MNPCLIFPKTASKLFIVLPKLSLFLVIYSIASQYINFISPITLSLRFAYGADSRKRHITFSMWRSSIFLIFFLEFYSFLRVPGGASIFSKSAEYFLMRSYLDPATEIALSVASLN